MVVLHCAFVGEGNEAIDGIETADQATFGYVKNLIKDCECYDFPASRLKLYLTKQNGDKTGPSMKDDDQDLIQLQKSTISKDMEAVYLKEELLLMVTWPIEEYLTGAPTGHTIHVLVKLPGDRTTMMSVWREQTTCYDHDATTTGIT